MRRMLPILMATAAIPATSSLAQNTVNIGLASAAKNEVIVVGETNNRGLKAGDTIFQNQHIRTGRNSAAQLLFRDETALTMGPSASLVLDKAVYDPSKHTGEITVRAVSGAFRFVSGSSPVGSYSINTPAGTVGIRGTWIDMLITGQTIRILVRRGRVQFCNLASQCANVIAGYEIRAAHNRIGTPNKVSHDTVESIVALWFKDASDANLAPGAGEGDQANANSKSFWWLNEPYRERAFRDDRGTFHGTQALDGSISPGSGPPGTNPGFPPISNSGVGIPPGLKTGPLPSGLARRDPETFLPPGQQKKK